jgi:hypothetical protein
VFGGFCLLFLFWLHSWRPVLWVWSVFASLILVALISSLIAFFGFCLESLILAQDERWRRA